MVNEKVPVTQSGGALAEGKSLPELLCGVLSSAISISEKTLFVLLPTPIAPLLATASLLRRAEQEVIAPAPWEGVLYILFYQISPSNFMNYELSTPFSTAIEYAS